MHASASFEFDGQSYRCVWVLPNTSEPGNEFEVYPKIRRIYMRGEFKKIPRPGQYCCRPHKLLKINL